MHSEKVLKAIEFIYDKHSNHYRKKSKIPYIVHLLDVMYILYYEREKDPSIDDDVIIGGLLHDVNEDVNVPFDEIERKFNKKVRDYVFNASEPEELKHKCTCKKENWKERKLHTINNISKIDLNSKYIICADKLSNLSSISNDICCVGEDKTWVKFNASKEEIKWYYSSCINEFEKDNQLKESYMFKKLKYVFENVFKE
jgi:(p)ppGpp synthase/HD superfamily hydrolase